MGGEDKEEGTRGRRKASVWDEEPGEARGNVSKWEVTPRTATQSKRLKWDQTPLGYIRVEDDAWSRRGMRGPSGVWDRGERGSRTDAVYSEMSLREINMCLPSKGYRRYDLRHESLDEQVQAEDLPDVSGDEKDFFMPALGGSSEAGADVYRGILLVKNGSKRMAAHGFRMLKRMRTSDVVEKVILMAMSLELDDKGKEKVVSLLLFLLKGADIQKMAHVREVLFVLGSYSYFPLLRRQCMTVLALVYRHGLELSVRSIENDFASKEPYIREVVGNVVGTFAEYFGTEEVRGLLGSLAASSCGEVRRTCIRCVVGICEFSGRGVAVHLRGVLDILGRMVVDRSRFIRVDAANAMSYVFRLVSPVRTAQMDDLFGLLRREVSRCGSIEFNPLLRAMSRLCLGSREHSEVVFGLLRHSGEQGVSGLKVYERVCDEIDGNESWEYFDKISGTLFSHVGRENANLVVSICTKMGGDPRVPRRILEYYSDPLNAGLISRIFSRLPGLCLDEGEAEEYYRAICNGLGHDDTTVGLVYPLVSKGFLQQRHGSMLMSETMRLIRSPAVDARVRGFKAMGNLARVLSTKELVQCGNMLVENMGDADQDVQPFVLKALCSVYNCHRFRHASDIVPNILPILKSREPRAVWGAVRLLHTICLNSAEECERIGAKEWMRVSYELVDSLASWNKGVRRDAAESLGCISKIVGPQEVLNILMDNLESEDRNQRAGSSLGISVVGEHNGLFSVLPTVLADYAVPSASVQHGVLKAMCHFFQRTFQESLRYVYSMLPMLEDAMMDEDPSYRCLGMALVRHVVLNHSAATADTRLVMHLLNLVWANVLDPTPAVQQAFDECMESFAAVLSSQAMYKYVVQGLFHPSRAVRERYGSVLQTMERFDSTTLSQCYLVEDELLGPGN